MLTSDASGPDPRDLAAWVCTGWVAIGQPDAGDGSSDKGGREDEARIVVGSCDSGGVGPAGRSRSGGGCTRAGVEVHAGVESGVGRIALAAPVHEGLHVADGDDKGPRLDVGSAVADGHLVAGRQHR
eukprot:scaffold15486_cov111-Isochrysis_galbana.AAC.13